MRLPFARVGQRDGHPHHPGQPPAIGRPGAVGGEQDGAGGHLRQRDQVGQPGVPFGERVAPVEVEHRGPERDFPRDQRGETREALGLGLQSGQIGADDRTPEFADQFPDKGLFPGAARPVQVEPGWGTAALGLTHPIRHAAGQRRETRAAASPGRLDDLTERRQPGIKPRLADQEAEHLVVEFDVL